MEAELAEAEGRHFRTDSPPHEGVYKARFVCLSLLRMGQACVDVGVGVCCLSSLACLLAQATAALVAVRVLVHIM